MYAATVYVTAVFPYMAWCWCEWQGESELYQNHAYGTPHPHCGFSMHRVSRNPIKVTKSAYSVHYKEIGKNFCFQEGSQSTLFPVSLYTAALVFMIDLIVNLRSVEVLNFGRTETDPRKLARNHAILIAFDVLSAIGACSLVKS